MFPSGIKIKINNIKFPQDELTISRLLILVLVHELHTLKSFGQTIFGTFYKGRFIKYLYD